MARLENRGSSLEGVPPRSTVYFDGSCPLCRAEIGHYRRVDVDRALCFVDVSQADAPVPKGLSRADALRRFHVRSGNGELISGARAFVELWAHLPHWRWAAKVARWPGAVAALELGYRAFLPLRPYVSRLYGNIRRWLARIDEAKRV